MAEQKRTTADLWRKVDTLARQVRGQDAISAEINTNESNSVSSGVWLQGVTPYWHELARALYGLGEFFASFSSKKEEKVYHPPKFWSSDFHLDLQGALLRDIEFDDNGEKKIRKGALPATPDDYIKFYDARLIQYLFRTRTKINIAKMMKELRDQSFEDPKKLFGKPFRNKVFAKRSSLVRRTAHELSKIPVQEYFDRIWFRISVLEHYFERQNPNYKPGGTTKKITTRQVNEDNNGVIQRKWIAEIVEIPVTEEEYISIPNQENLDHLYYYEPRNAKEWRRQNVKEYAGSSEDEVQESFELPVNSLSNHKQGLIIGSSWEHDIFGIGKLVGHDKSRTQQDLQGNILNFDQVILYLEFPKDGLKRILAKFCKPLKVDTIGTENNESKEVNN